MTGTTDTTGMRDAHAAHGSAAPPARPGSATASFTAEAWERAAPVRDAIDALPLVRGLGDGSLTRDRFDYYMAQDALYLAEYGRALAGVAASMPPSAWKASAALTSSFRFSMRSCPSRSCS